MSTAQRGRGGDRGGRSRGTPFRGASNPRGNFGGPRMNGHSDAATTPSGPGGQNAGPRGGAQRGGGSTRWDNSRGRGDRMIPPSTALSTVKNTTSHPNDSYQARFNQLEEDRPRQRAQLIKEGRMNPDRAMKLSDAVKLVGICNDMCPEFERVRRIVQDDVKTPECTPETAHGDRSLRKPDESRMVKAYKRSAAGDETELVTDIRSPSACLKTMKHMITRLDSEELPFLYGWLWDRTRAIRKDLRTQAVDKREDIKIYLQCFEQCARLHLICLHRMNKATSPDYVHQQDLEQLMQTHTSLKERYTDNRRANIISPDEAEFQAYRLIVSVHTNDSLIEHEVQNLPEHLRRNGRIKTALQIYQAGKAVIHKRSRQFVEARQNWKDFWALIQSPAVSYLMACAAEILFNEVRRIVLDTIYRAYRQGKANKVIPMQDWTLPELIKVLGFDNHNQVIEFCVAYKFSFGTTETGEHFLDINSLPYQAGPLQEPNEMTPQFFSNFVELKRHNRTLSAVIEGMSVQAAMSKGLVVESELTVGVDTEQNMESEDSLFVPEHSTTKPTDIVTGSDIAEFSNGVTAAPNPFASTNTPASRFNTGVSSANPFMAKTKAPVTNTGIFGTPSGPSIVNSNGNSSDAPKSGFGIPSFPPQTSTNPLAGRSATTTSPATGQSVQPGLFDASKNGVKFAAAPNGASPFSNVNSGSFFPATTTTTPANAANQPASQIQSPFSFPAISSTDNKPKAGSGFNFFSSAPASAGSGLPSFTKSSSSSLPQGSTGTALGIPTISTTPLATPNPASTQPQSSSDEEGKRRIQCEQERLAKEVKDTQERAARKAQEEEVQQRARVALQRAKEEKEEQQRRAQEAQQQREERVRQKKEATLTTIATNLVHDSEAGLMKQYVENQIEYMFHEVAAYVRWERLERYANEKYHHLQVARARRFFAHWVAMTLKKKRTNHARERRRWLKANTAAILALENEANNTNGIPTIEDAPKTALAKPKAPEAPAKFKKPTAPASAATRAQKVPKQQEKTSAVQLATKISRHSKAASLGSSMMLYKNPKAPIDRTQTDWFKLRAAGIDPSIHRKRSFGSASDEEEDTEADRKRRRKSTSSAPRASLPPPTTDEERLARFHTVREALGKPGSTPRAINNARSVNGYASVLIAQAREILSTTSTPKASPPILQHEFSRSVPDLNLRASSGSLSAFGKSVGTSASKDRPAYWARQSRFVPQHLYGKGKEAVLEYRKQFRRSTSTSTSVEPAEHLGPLYLSSPIPVQQPYAPEQFIEDLGSEAGYESHNVHSGIGEEEDGDLGEDEDEELDFEYDEDEEEEEEEEEEEVDYGAYTKMDYDYGEQNAQNVAGGTQNAPIELDSD